jgi:hypothetical protein
MATRVASALAFLLAARGAHAEPLPQAEMSAACLADGDSYRSNPELGTLLHWADCLEDSGRVASAYSAFQDAVALAARTGDARAENAERHRAALQPRLSYVTVSVSPEHRVPGLTVARDGFGVGSASWGLPVATDPGHHRVHVSAPGYRSLDLDFDLNGDAAVATLEIPALEREPEVAPPLLPEAVAIARPIEAVPVAQTPAAPAQAVLPMRLSAEPLAAPKKQGREQPHSLSANQKDALVVGGVSVASLAASLYFFGNMHSKLAARNADCPSGTGCPRGTNAMLQQLTDDATSDRSVGLVLLGIGATTTALALELWTFTPARPGATRRASLRAALTPWGGSVQHGGEL